MTDKPVTLQFAVPENLANSLSKYLDATAVASEKTTSQRALNITLKIIVGVLVLIYAGYIIYTAQGRSVMPARDHAAVIAISGVIGGGAADQQPETVNGLVTRAFQNDATRAVILHVNSSGGSPSVADRIGRHARTQADRYQKPLIVHIDGAGASAAYLVALYADEIYASQYSITGSVGAVINALNWKDLADRIGIQHSAIASSDFKSALSPWQAANAEHQDILQELVDGIADTFVAQVVAARGDRLVIETSELRKARIYRSSQALELGLIDGIGTLEQIANDELGLPVHRIQARRNLYEQFVTLSLREFIAAMRQEAELQ